MVCVHKTRDNRDNDEKMNQIVHNKNQRDNTNDNNNKK